MIADWLIRLTTAQRKWGFGLCFLCLRNIKGFRWNHKRVYRFYCCLLLKMGDYLIGTNDNPNGEQGGDDAKKAQGNFFDFFYRSLLAESCINARHPRRTHEVAAALSRCRRANPCNICPARNRITSLPTACILRAYCSASSRKRSCSAVTITAGGKPSGGETWPG